MSRLCRFFTCTSCVTRTVVRSYCHLRCVRKFEIRSPTDLLNYVYFNHLLTIKPNSTSVPHVEDSWKVLAVHLSLDHNVLMQSLKDRPELERTTSSQWENCFQLLMSHGLTVEESLRIVTKYPPLLKTNVKVLEAAFAQWRGVNLGEKYVLSLLKAHPQFLQLSPQEISIRIAHLKTLGSSKSVVELLKGAPAVMIESWDTVLAKLSFLLDEMKIDKKVILRSFALNRSLLFLKTRFIFLVRCGKYVKPKLKADPNVPSNNPPLKHIVDTNDEHFVTKVAGLVMEEFDVFQELFALEIKEELSGSESE